jgi:hypothetical protein
VLRCLLLCAAFVHSSVTGGETWDALYVREAQRSPLGATVPAVGAAGWVGNGLMDQSSWGVGWSDKQHVFGWYTDIRGTISANAGESWSFNFSGHKLNTMCILWRIHTWLDLERQ